MLRKLRAFLDREDGSINEFVVIAAGSVALAMAVSGAVRDGGQSAADTTDTAMQDLGGHVKTWVEAGVDG